jgi:hypothetical protein
MPRGSSTPFNPWIIFLLEACKKIVSKLLRSGQAYFNQKNENPLPYFFSIENKS